MCIRDSSFVARAFAGDPKHLQEMMAAALQHTGGFALLDILQPCPTYNKQNTFKWYRERVTKIEEGHDPHDRSAALELAFTWGDRIPIGIIYKHDRPTFESHFDVLKKGTLVSQYEAG